MHARRICCRVVASLFAMHLCRRHSRVLLLIVPCSCLRLSGTPCNSSARKPPRVYHIRWRKTAPAFVSAKLIGSKVRRHFFRSRQCEPRAPTGRWERSESALFLPRSRFSPREIRWRLISAQSLRSALLSANRDALRARSEADTRGSAWIRVQENVTRVIRRDIGST